ncbi:hypothetical protein EAX61_09555 [Dokdonia sinensis]|uniref:TonB-dependent receptor n=2 Tax=Dokdonia sinensis TaxID=2479847 RepID=A0A3M0G129_9FLAO|nr:hypothetical protein EAX61_09555 [Dokdonia sinensis]
MFGQRGIVSGTLEADGGPLPGANVIIKGTSIGTQTDFDGNYSIECQVGDTLLITFVGYDTREVLVTPALLGFEEIPYSAPREAVPMIKSIAYSDAVQRASDSLHSIPSLNSSPYMYTKRNGYRSFRGIKSIKQSKNIVTLKYSDGELYVDGTYKGSMQLRTITDKNLPSNGINPYASVLSTNHRVNTSIWDNNIRGGLSLNYGIGNDNYLSTVFHNEGISANFNTQGSYKIPLQIQLGYNSATDNLANLNGYQNLLLGRQLTNAQFQENPLLALNGNESISKSKNFRTAVSAEKSFGLDFKLIGTQSLVISDRDEEYRLNAGSFGYESDYRSGKRFNNLQSNTALTFQTNFEILNSIGVNTTSKIQWQHSEIDYDFNEVGNENPLRTSQELNQGIFEMQHNINLDYNNHVFLNLTNTSIASTRQAGALLVPQVSISAVPTEIWYGLDNGFIDYINVSARYGETVSASGLFYDNYAHQSLLLEDTQALQLLNNRDLFYPEDLALESGRSFEVATEFRLFYNRLRLGFTYENRKDDHGIFPVRLGDGFVLDNLANTRTKGFDISLRTININGYDDSARWTTEVTLSRKRTKTSSLLNGSDRVSIAGFSNVNANLIPGASAGVIVGTAFERNDNGVIVTDSQENPVIAEGVRIIGDPTPDFILGITNHLDIGRWNVALSVDYQQGGDIWNGTQKALNNFTDADESYVEEATFINIKSLSATYELVDEKKWNNSGHLPFFNSFKISVFANNLATSTAYRGATPYSSAFDNQSAMGIQYFNTPLQLETGFSIIAKI